MTSEELAQQYQEFMERGKSRIMGTGKEQYELGGTQLFETLQEGRLAEMFDEELLDASVYAAMWAIRLQRMAAARKHQGVMDPYLLLMEYLGYDAGGGTVLYALNNERGTRVIQPDDIRRAMSDLYILSREGKEGQDVHPT